MTAALIKRLEAATGPDREVDAELWLMFTTGATRKASVVKSSKGLWPDYTIDETREASGRLIVVPSYTASVDAALALAERVLPGWCWELTLMPGEATWQGAPEMWPEGLAAPDRCGVYASTKSPALALCIAVLKAQS